MDSACPIEQCEKCGQAHCFAWTGTITDGQVSAFYETVKLDACAAFAALREWAETEREKAGNPEGKPA